MFKRAVAIVVPTLIVAFAAATPPLRAQQGDKDAIKRLEAELTELKKRIKDREELLLRVVSELQMLKETAIAERQNVKALQDRNLELLAQIQALTKLNRELGGKASVQSPPADINPPPGQVKGRIERVDPNDPALVTITIGADQGLAKGHTLEVYRLKPEPRYLGIVRIIEVTSARSVGRLIAPAGAKRAQLQVGDEVASRLTPDREDDKKEPARKKDK